MAVKSIILNRGGIPMSASEFLTRALNINAARFSLDGSGNIIGFIDADGAAVDGAPPSFTWATKPADGATGYVNTVVLITNLHSRGTTGGSLWMNTTDGYICVSDPVRVTWSQMSDNDWFGVGSALAPATWPGLRVRVTDYFVGGADVVSDGTRFRLVGSRATLKNPAESSFSVVAINQTTQIVAFAAWPKGLYANGDRIIVTPVGEKSGTSDTQTHKFAYSTTSDTYDSSTVILTTNALATTSDSLATALPIERKSSTVMKLKGLATISPQPGVGQTALAADVTVTDLDTTPGFVLWTVTTGANETFTPTGFLVELLTCGE